nr:hypothetical protein [Candidatus Prometheoarchaeum syntrophicum]
MNTEEHFHSEYYICCCLTVLIGLLLILSYPVFVIIGFIVVILIADVYIYIVESRKKKILSEKLESFSLKLLIEIPLIENFIIKFEFDEGIKRINNLKDALNVTRKFKIPNNEKIKIIEEKINPLIAQVPQIKLQKKILDKFYKLYNEFKSQNQDHTNARKIFNYYFDIRKKFYSKEIPHNLFIHIKELIEDSDHNLKKNLIESKIKKEMNPLINFEFLYEPLIYYFDVFDNWKILQDLKAKYNLKLKEINSIQFQEFIQKGSLQIITRNLRLLSKANLNNVFLTDISWLVKGNHKIKDLIHKTLVN